MTRTTNGAMSTRAFSVALVGADGAGKTTIARHLECEHSLPVRYLYMGLNPAASNHLLPTTRLLRLLRPDTDRAGGPPDLASRRPSPARGAATRLRRSVRSGLRTANLVAEEWYRQARAWGHLRRGTVVVYDRHFLADYHAHDLRGGRSLPLSRRLHGFLLARAYPRPDLVICLDAPAEVLYQRKPEGSIELLARRRQEYLDLAGAEGGVVVIDAGRPLSDVTADVFSAVSEFAAAQGGRTRRSGGRERAT
jgi:thymidylate kinase